MKQEYGAKEKRNPIVEIAKKAIGISLIFLAGDLALKSLINVATINNAQAELDVVSGAVYAGAGLIALRNSDNSQRKNKD